MKIPMFNRELLVKFAKKGVCKEALSPTILVTPFVVIMDSFMTLLTI